MTLAFVGPCRVSGCRGNGCVLDGYPQPLCLLHENEWEASKEYARAYAQFMDEVAFCSFDVARDDWFRRVLAEAQNA